MKYEITKGAKEVFELAPEWATLVVAGRHYNKAWISHYANGARALAFGTKDEYVIEAIDDCEVIAERRPITEPVWDGEGVPPVGVECELKSEEYADYDWVKVRIVFEHNGELIAIVNMPDEPIHDRMSKHSSGYDAAKFRPIRSPEDVARDEATKAMNEVWREHAGKEHNGKLFSIYEIIYEGIAAGKIPGVKLEVTNGN